MTVLHVANFILEQSGAMSAMKLQKLAYYSQAWHLVWDEEPLFDDRIEAWANGPVSPTLYSYHRGKFAVDHNDLPGDSSELTDAQRDTILSVLKFYGDKTAQWLSDLTHMERPWLSARDGMAPGERSNREISIGSMAEYYSSL